MTCGDLPPGLNRPGGIRMRAALNQGNGNPRGRETKPSDSDQSSVSVQHSRRSVSDGLTIHQVSARLELADWLGWQSGSGTVWRVNGVLDWTNARIG
jgi:hypothetical protein